MTQEEKELLLKDLCARLPYGVICKSKSYRNILFNSSHISLIESEEIKPYLRPMSSMTEEEKEEIKCRWVFTEKCRDENDIADINNRGMVEICDISSFINWLISHHFDYNGLISKGLALEAPESMYI